MKKIAIAIIVSVSLITGCKKEIVEAPVSAVSPPTSNKYHFPITIGSYWIYENLNMDSSYNITSISGIDSIFVSSDTMINGKQYCLKKIVNLSGTYSYANMIKTVTRDSAGYDVDPSGAFIKTDDFVNILDTKIVLNPPYTVVSWMKNKDSVVTVPAGSFTTVNYFSQVTIQDPDYTGNRIKDNNCVIANNIGVVYGTSSWYSSPTKLGIRLLRYHIAN